MSDPSDSVGGIDRRTLLRRAAVLLGGSLSAPALLGVWQGRRAHAATEPAARFLQPDQYALVADISEIMIPRTATPGARDVGVPAFIDEMLADVYPAADQARFVTGLEAFRTAVGEQTGRAFLELEPAQRQAYVQRAHDTALAAGGPGGVAPDQRPFILMTKELVLLGFFTSEAGATQVLQYEAVPGAWHACLPLAEAGNGRTWAVATPLPF